MNVGEGGRSHVKMCRPSGISFRPDGPVVARPSAKERTLKTRDSHAR